MIKFAFKNKVHETHKTHKRHKGHKMHKKHESCTSPYGGKSS